VVRAADPPRPSEEHIGPNNGQTIHKAIDVHVTTSTLRHIPEAGSAHNHRCEALKPNWPIFCVNHLWGYATRSARKSYERRALCAKRHARCTFIAG
jgi:hypothetical protein